MTDQPSPALAEARRLLIAYAADGSDEVVVFALDLLRTMVAEETVEAVAEKLADRLFNPERYGGWINLTDYGKFPYREAARAVLTALLERATERK